MTFFKHMIPGFREAYKMKQDQKQYEEIQKQKYRVRIPLQDYPIQQPKLLSNNQKTPLTKHQEGGPVERADNTRVQKPISGVIPKDSEVRTYDGIPVRVNKNYPWQDKYQLEAPTRKLNLPWKKQQINVKYPHIYGVELTALTPQYMQVIDGNDTTYYVQGNNKEYYKVAGQSGRPIFREMFNKKPSPPKYDTNRVPHNFVRNLK